MTKKLLTLAFLILVLLVQRCTSEAAQMLRDLIYTAWLETGVSTPVPGRLQPTDPRHPKYNPATGSAPAAPSPR